MSELKQLESLSLQVNFSPEERQYFGQLKAELLELFQGKEYDEILKSEDTTLLKKISFKLEQLVKFVSTRERPLVDDRWGKERLTQWLMSQGFVRDLAKQWISEFVFFNEQGEMGLSSSLDRIYEFEGVSELPPNLNFVEGGLFISGFKGRSLPRDLMVAGHLNIDNSRLIDIPDGLYVCDPDKKSLRRCDVYARNVAPQVVAKLQELKARGQISGEIITT